MFSEDAIVKDLISKWESVPDCKKTPGVSDETLAVALLKHRDPDSIDYDPTHAVLVESGLDANGYPRYRKKYKGKYCNTLWHRFNAIQSLGLDLSLDDARLEGLVARHMVWLGDQLTTRKNVNPRQLMLGTPKENLYDNYTQSWSGKKITSEMGLVVSDLRDGGMTWDTVCDFMHTHHGYTGTAETLRMHGREREYRVPDIGPIHYCRNRFSRYVPDIFDTDGDIYFNRKSILINGKYYNVFKTLYVCKIMIQESVADSWDEFHYRYNCIDPKTHNITHVKDDGHLNQINPKFLGLSTVKQNMYDRVNSGRGNYVLTEEVAGEIYKERLSCDTRSDYLNFIDRWVSKGYSKTAIWQCIAQRSHAGMGPSMGYIPYSESDIIKLRYRLLTNAEIADIIGCDSSRVWQILKSNGVSVFKNSDRNCRSVAACLKLGIQKQADISRLTSLSPAAVSKHIKRIRKGCIPI